MDLYCLISCIPRMTNRFTQKWTLSDENHNGNFFLFLKHIIKQVKASGKILLVEVKIFY